RSGVAAGRADCSARQLLAFDQAELLKRRDRAPCEFKDPPLLAQRPDRSRARLDVPRRGLGADSCGALTLHRSTGVCVWAAGGMPRHAATGVRQAGDGPGAGCYAASRKYRDTTKRPERGAGSGLGADYADWLVAVAAEFAGVLIYAGGPDQWSGLFRVSV